MRKFSQQLLLVTLLVGATFAPTSFGVVYASEPPTISATAAVVMDAATGTQIYAKNQAAFWPPASLSKLVSAMVYLKFRSAKLSTVKMQASDEVGGARLAVKVGAKYRCDDLMVASLMASANNAARALTRCAGKTEPEFVEEMNKLSQSLGANRTYFAEPSGIDTRSVTTPEEYALILNSAVSDQRIRSILMRSSQTIKAVSPKKSHYLTSTNLLLKQGFPVNGGKTGYLDESRYNFAVQVRLPNGKLANVVVLGSPTRNDNFNDAKSLVNWLIAEAQAEMTKGGGQ